MRRIFIIFAGFFLYFVFLNDVSAKVESGARILNQSASARAAAMGDAFVAVSDDLGAVYYNPAGLINILSNRMSFMYLGGFVDEAYINMGANISMGNKGTIAGNVFYYDGGNFDWNDNGTLTKIKAQQDILASLSYGFPVTAHFSAGINLKTLQSTLVEEYKANAFAVDIGFLHSLIGENSTYQFGAAVQNAGTELKYIEEADALPLNIRAGASYLKKLGNDYKLTVSVEGLKPSDGDIKEHIGFEFVLKEMFSIRAGYKLGYDLNTLTAGIGISVKNYSFDYGFSLMDELEQQHRVSFSHTFSEAPKSGGSRAKKVNRKSHWAAPVETEVIEDKVATPAYIPPPAQKEISQSRTAYEKSYIYGNCWDYSKYQLKPLGNVVIKVSQEDKIIERIYADGQGEFKTRPLESGTYEVQAWKQGFPPLQQKINLEDKPIKLNLEMIPKNIPSPE